MSSEKSEVIYVSCNWNVGNGKELKSCLSILGPKQQVEFEQLVTLESCVCLSKADSDELPEISLRVVLPGAAITDVYVVSEARTLELYGQGSQYEGTTKGQDSEAGDDEMKVYNARLRLNPPSTECSLRFAGGGKSDMWILGLGVSIAPVSPAAVNNLTSRVNHLLSNMELSTSAEQCRRLVMASASQAPPVTSEPVIFRQMIEKCCSDLENRLTQHIDQHFQRLEERLMTKLEQLNVTNT